MDAEVSPLWLLDRAPCRDILSSPVSINDEELVSEGGAHSEGLEGGAQATPTQRIHVAHRIKRQEG